MTSHFKKNDSDASTDETATGGNPSGPPKPQTLKPTSLSLPEGEGSRVRVALRFEPESDSINSNVLIASSRYVEAERTRNKYR